MKRLLLAVILGAALGLCGGRYGCAERPPAVIFAPTDTNDADRIARLAREVCVLDEKVQRLQDALDDWEATHGNK
jgi:hypothetical protein